MKNLKKFLVLVIVCCLVVLLTVPVQAQASTKIEEKFVTGLVHTRGSADSRPVIINLGGEYYEQYDAYKYITLQIKDPDTIKYYKVNGHKVNGNKKKSIVLSELKSTSKFCHPGRNTIYVYDRFGHEGSWAFNLLDLEDPECPALVEKPVVIVSESGSKRVKGTEKTFTKLTIQLKGTWICSYKLNGRKHTIDACKKYTLKNLKKNSKDCRKGKNTIYVYDIYGNEGSWTFYLK